MRKRESVCESLREKEKQREKERESERERDGACVRVHISCPDQCMSG